SGDYQKALTLYQKLLSSPDASDDVNLRAYLLAQIADADIEIGAYEPAQANAQEALTALAQAQLAQSPVYALAERLLADALHAQGFDEQAKPIAEQALSLATKVFPQNSEGFAFTLTSLAQISKELDDLNRSQKLCQQAVDIFRRNQPPDPYDLGIAYQNLAVVQLAKNKTKEALATLDLALETWSTAVPADYPSRLYALNTKLIIYTKLKNFQEAGKLIPHLLALSESRFGPDHPERVILLNNAATLYVAEKQYSLALPLLREAVAISERRLAAGHPMRRGALENYAFVLVKLNRREDAARAIAESNVVRVSPSLNSLLPNVHSLSPDHQ
ncbi:MAG: tetratricopeptide repeat protein, partial [Acidobacteriaceae bacterium]|nr:tetratricopeptide repeat protein [Acidobacteriaceae bacterium]